MRKGSAAQANSYLERLLELEPDARRTRYLVAVARQEEGRYLESRPILDRLFEENPLDARVKDKLIRAYAERPANLLRLLQVTVRYTKAWRYFRRSAGDLAVDDAGGSRR